MGELSILMRAFLENLAICLRLSVVFRVITSFLFKIFAVAHFNGSLALRLSHAVVQDQCVLVLDLEFRQLLSDQSLDFLENLHVVLSDKSDCFASLASTCSAADTMDVIFGVGRDVKIDTA